MFVLFLIYRAKYLLHYLTKTNGYVVLKRKCNPLYMRKIINIRLKINNKFITFMMFIV